jgi:hypothetical protein
MAEYPALHPPETPRGTIKSQTFTQTCPIKELHHQTRSLTHLHCSQATFPYHDHLQYCYPKLEPSPHQSCCQRTQAHLKRAIEYLLHSLVLAAVKKAHVHICVHHCCQLSFFIGRLFVVRMSPNAFHNLSTVLQDSLAHCWPGWDFYVGMSWW